MLLLPLRVVVVVVCCGCCGDEEGDKPHHVTTNSLRSVPSGLLKLNSFIRHSE